VRITKKNFALIPKMTRDKKNILKKVKLKKKSLKLEESG
jgi:hypothetical protein